MQQAPEKSPLDQLVEILENKKIDFGIEDLDPYFNILLKDDNVSCLALSLAKIKEVNLLINKCNATQDITKLCKRLVLEQTLTSPLNDTLTFTEEPASLHKTLIEFIKVVNNLSSKISMAVNEKSDERYIELLNELVGIFKTEKSKLAKIEAAYKATTEKKGIEEIDFLINKVEDFAGILYINHEIDKNYYPFFNLLMRQLEDLKSSDEAIKTKYQSAQKKYNKIKESFEILGNCNQFTFGSTGSISFGMKVKRVDKKELDNFSTEINFSGGRSFFVKEFTFNDSLDAKDDDEYTKNSNQP